MEEIKKTVQGLHDHCGLSTVKAISMKGTWTATMAAEKQKVTRNVTHKNFNFSNLAFLGGNYN